MIRRENLTGRLGSFAATDHSVFSVEKRSVFGFLCLNGLDGTTVLPISWEMLESSQDRPQIAGVDGVRETDRIKAAIGGVWQKLSLCGELTVNENSLFCGESCGLRGEALRLKRDDAGRGANLQRARQAPPKLQERRS